MFLRLHNYWRSSASHRVRIALALKNLPYEYVAVPIKPGADAQHDSGYLKRNPEGRVPTLEANGHVLTQSMAILEWLDEVVPNPPLLPADPWDRAHVRGLTQLIVADIQPLQNLSAHRQLRALGINDAGITSWIHHWINRGLSAFEQQLVRGRPGPFCHGTAPTLADICLIPQCHAARRFGVSLAPFSLVSQIEQHCLSLECFQTAAPENQPDAEAAT